MKKRSPLKSQAAHALRQPRGALTSARLAKELETNSKDQRKIWGCTVAMLREAERSLMWRVAEAP